MMSTLVLVLVLVAAGINVIGLCAFAYDKRQARIQGWRISRASLVALLW